MNRTLISAAIFGALCVGFVGCGDKATIKKETTVTTPGGSTTTTTTQEVKKTGDNPPPARP